MIPFSPEQLAALPRWAFGDNPAMADELLALVLQGKKTATCCALVAHEEDPLPPVGSYQIILDGQGRDACLIQNMSQHLARFCDIDEHWAAQEGEGDLAHWQNAHRTFFTALGCYAPDMWLVCETFRVVADLRNTT